jgi:hypothetical protein
MSYEHPSAVLPPDLATSIATAKAATAELSAREGKVWRDVPPDTSECPPDLLASIERAREATAALDRRAGR